MKKPKSNQPQQQYMQNPYMSPNYPYYMPQPQQPQPGGQQVQGQGQSQGGPPPPSSGGSGAPQDPNQLPIEESYIENILRLKIIRSGTRKSLEGKLKQPDAIISF